MYFSKKYLDYKKQLNKTDLRFIRNEILQYTFLPSFLGLYFIKADGNDYQALLPFNSISSAINISINGEPHGSRQGIKIIIVPGSQNHTETDRKNCYNNRQLLILKAYCEPAYDFVITSMNSENNSFLENDFYKRCYQKSQLYLNAIAEAHFIKKPIEDEFEINIFTLLILGFKPDQISQALNQNKKKIQLKTRKLRTYLRVHDNINITLKFWKWILSKRILRGKKFVEEQI